MARKKVRVYPSVDYMRKMINKYFEEHRDEVIEDLLQKTEFLSLEDLRKADFLSYFGLDCGYVRLITYNDKQHAEWILDNGKYDAYVGMLNFPYNTQSITCKSIQLKKAIKDLNLGSQYGIYMELD